jgi:RNA polymerase sigma-70 factor (ECF subfamily)
MEILQRCLDALPPRLARLFMLREVMEEDSENICQELAITPTNLWTMLYRARLGLRQCLDRNWVGNAVHAAARG